jgi:hypothetical protein
MRVSAIGHFALRAERRSLTSHFWCGIGSAGGQRSGGSVQLHPHRVECWSSSTLIYATRTEKLDPLRDLPAKGEMTVKSGLNLCAYGYL